MNRYLRQSRSRCARPSATFKESLVDGEKTRRCVDDEAAEAEEENSSVRRGGTESSSRDAKRCWLMCDAMNARGAPSISTNQAGLWSARREKIRLAAESGSRHTGRWTGQSDGSECPPRCAPPLAGPPASSAATTNWPAGSINGLSGKPSHQRLSIGKHFELLALQSMSSVGL